MALRILGLAILAAGIALLVLGSQATNALTESLRRQITGEYSDRTTLYKE